MLNLIPSVKSLEIKSGYLKSRAVRFDGDSLDNRVWAAVEKLPLSQNGAEIIFQIGEIGEGYELFIDEESIRVVADGNEGAFYAVQTLRQIFKEEKIPCLYIKDYPDFKYRGFYHDVTRGKIPTVETIKKLIDEMAYYKLNSLQLYVEHPFEFEEYKEIRYKYGYLTREEIQEIGAYCKKNFVSFIPSLSTFGHLYELLSLDKYKDLRVLKDYENTPNYWRQRMEHHTIDPLEPESIEVIKSLISQYVPNFENEYFNICCDETFDLKSYTEKGLDESKLYVDFVKKIISHVKDCGKTVMMWADILLQHPETIDELPEDTVFLNWDYDAAPHIENIEKLAKMNRTQIVCPGSWTWKGFCEDIFVEEKNIAIMAEEGFKHGAMGVLNTNWGDWGNPCSLDLAMYGLVLGAQKSWSAMSDVGDKYKERVNEVLYECPRGVEFLTRLGELMMNLNWFRFGDKYFEYRYNMIRDCCGALSCDFDKFMDKAETLKADLLATKWEKGDYKNEMLIAVEGYMVLAELYEKMLGNKIESKTDALDWIEKYSDKWLQKNKPSELFRIKEMIEYIEKN